MSEESAERKDRGFAGTRFLRPRSAGTRFLRPRSDGTRRLLAIACLAGGGLALEVALTRLLATRFYPPYVFAVLSLAVLGIGVGAAVAARWPAFAHAERIPLMMTAAAMSALLAILLIIRVAAIADAALFLALALPYVASGMALATLFREQHAQSARWYMADLLGAGLGVALVVLAMQALGAVNGALLAVVCLALAALLWHAPLAAAKGRHAPLAAAKGWHARPLPALAAAVLVLLFIANLRTEILPLNWQALDDAKPLRQAWNEGATIEATRWDAFGRADLLTSVSGARQLYLDGAAPSVLPAAQDIAELTRQIGYLPFASGQPDAVFIIGPGGGLDIAYARASGAERIVAVEVHPASVALLREQEARPGGLLDSSAVELRVDEGRSALRRETSEFDLISLSQVVTLAAERGGYALTENTLYTVEAFREFLARLTPEGQLALVLYDEATMLRALGVALAALSERGLTEQQALQHVLIVADARSGALDTPLLVIKSTPWRREELRGPAVFVADQGYQPIHFPGVLAAPPLDAIAAGTSSFAEATADSRLNFAPPTDDRPFFFQFEYGAPRSLRELAAGIGVVIVLGALALAWRSRGRAGAGAARERAALYAYVAALGAGFMLLEVALIQQTRLLLGHPTPAVALTLAALLVAGGLGSASATWLWRGRTLWAAPLAVAGLTLAWWLLWGPWSEALAASALPVRAVGTLLSLLPLAWLMGMAFPNALRRAGVFETEAVAWCWAVNGVMSVLGTVGALVLATSWGYGSVLLVGAGVYGVAGVVGIITTNNKISGIM